MNVRYYSPSRFSATTFALGVLTGIAVSGAIALLIVVANWLP
jgi:hypothetical protein